MSICHTAHQPIELNVTEVRLTVSKTINLGDYNSIKVEAGLTASVEAGEDCQDVAAALNDELRSILALEYRSHK